MTLGRKDFSVTRTNGGADVFGLAGFLRDDDLIGHKGSFRRIGSTEAKLEHIGNEITPQAVPDTSSLRILGGTPACDVTCLRAPTRQDGGLSTTLPRLGSMVRIPSPSQKLH
jgi:hypothetical protein